MQKNIKAIAVGFFLILIIGAVTYYKSAKKPAASVLDKIPPKTEKEQASKKISSEDLLKKIENREKIYIIDIRGREEYEKEHILDSENLSYAEIEQRISALDRNRSYVFVNDGKSFDAANLAMGLAAKSGFKNISYLEGGFSDWKDKYSPTVSIGDPDSFIDRSKVKYISSEDLKGIISGSEKNFAVIDVREKEKFGEGHIKDAVNIFLEDIEKRRKEIPLGKKIILYGDDGLAAFKAVVRLFDMGFFGTLALSDGFSGWKQKGYEIVK